MQPVVTSSEFMKEMSAVRMVSTFQMGFQVSGWKSEIDRHMRFIGSNLPEGVIIMMPGGFIGYSGGNMIFP